MESNEDKKLRFLRGLDKLRASKVKSDDYTSDLDKDVMKVKGGGVPKPEEVTRIKGTTQKISTKNTENLLSGEEFTSKIARMLKSNAAKKALSVIPMAGTAAGLLSGDPAMAAEEAAGDIPVLGQMYEAVKPTSTGDVDEERTMIAERNAREDYKKSPASNDKLKEIRLKALKRLIGND